MSADTNSKTIQTMYEAFGRGDVDAILGNLTDVVDWAADGPAGAAPWYGRCTSHDQVRQFFLAFGSTVEVSEFTPVSLAATDTEVFALITFTGTVRATGKPLSMHLHHYFRFRDGQVEYYRGSEDSAQTVAALAG